MRKMAAFLGAGLPVIEIKKIKQIELIKGKWGAEYSSN